MSNTTFLELQQQLDAKIAAAQVSGFWSAAMKKQAINNAGERVCNFHNWKKLEYALKTVTKENQEYYDYPDEFQENSIYDMEIDGEPYDKRKWEEYQAAKKAGSSEKTFASHNGFYFVNPRPSRANLEISIWGIRKWVKLIEDNDESITPSELDEPIIKLALATCLQKERRYAEATAEISEVEMPVNPNVPGSGGILARLKEQEETGDAKGYVGTAKSSRWN